LTFPGGFTREETSEALQPIEASAVQELYTQCFLADRINILVCGHTSEQQASELAWRAAEALKPTWSRTTDEPAPPVQRLIPPPQSKLILKQTVENPACRDHAISYRLFFGSEDRPEDTAACALLWRLINERAFDQLRTKGGLGYSCCVNPIVQRQWKGLEFYLHRERWTCEALETVVDKLLDEFARELPNLSETDFEPYQKAEALGWERRDTALEGEVDGFWNRVTDGSRQFDKGMSFPILSRAQKPKSPSAFTT
jgi:secreted Zn-dependent insulinase-like peptidase